jgi:hypothetical protein
MDPGFSFDTGLPIGPRKPTSRPGGDHHQPKALPQRVRYQMKTMETITP